MCIYIYYVYIYMCVYTHLESVHPVPNLNRKNCSIGLQELFVLRHQLRVVLGSTFTLLLLLCIMYMYIYIHIHIHIYIYI